MGTKLPFTLPFTGGTTPGYFAPQREIMQDALNRALKADAQSHLGLMISDAYIRIVIRNADNTDDEFYDIYLHQDNWHLNRRVYPDPTERVVIPVRQAGKNAPWPSTVEGDKL